MSPSLKGNNCILLYLINIHQLTNALGQYYLPRVNKSSCHPHSRATIVYYMRVITDRERFCCLTILLVLKCSLFSMFYKTTLSICLICQYIKLYFNYYVRKVEKFTRKSILIQVTYEFAATYNTICINIYLQAILP